MARWTRLPQGIGGGAVWAVVSGAIAIGLPLVMFVLFARQLSPLVVGQFALAVALGELLKMFGLPGLYEAMLQRGDETGQDQRAAMGVFLVSGALLIPIHLALLHWFLDATGGLPSAGGMALLALTALRIPLDLALLQPQAELARRRAFARLAQRNILANAGAAMLGLAGIAAGQPLLGLALYTLGLSACAALATIIGTSALRAPAWDPARIMAMRGEALPASAARGTSVALMQMDQLALGAWLGPIAFAHYNVGKRIEMAFVSVANTFSQTLFQPYFAGRRLPGESAVALRQAMGLVTITCGAGAAVFIATADIVVAWLLGPAWAPAVPAAMLLAVAGHGRALASACSALLSVSGGNAALFRLFLASAVVGLAMVALAAPFGALAVAAAVTLRVLGTLVLLARLTRHQAGPGWVAALLEAALGFGAMLAAAMLGRWAMPADAGIGALLMASAAVAAVALVVLLRLAPRARLAAP